MPLTIANRYRLGSELGSGGMGTVYKATDTRTNETVAVKQLHKHLTDAHLIERFRREGEALRELNHPNIVKMLDAIEEDENHYLVMEYIAGHDLATLIEQESLSLSHLLNVAIDLADALTRAHRLDIIHRDLKPANILIAPDNTLRLTDFGVAHLHQKERVTGTDVIVGTVDYLPPEVFDGQPFDTRGDIWAFGVLLFEMLTGERPFTGSTMLEVIQAITTHSVPDLELNRPGVSLPLVDLIYRMLVKNPDDRIRSVRQIGLELEDILHGRTVSGTASDKRDHTRRFKQHTTQTTYITTNNLPNQATPFVGRASELQNVEQLLAQPENRLITIIAQGGMGKTRLSLEVARQQLAHYPDGVYLVELAPLTSAENIVPAIAEAIDYTFQSDAGTPTEQLLAYLEKRRMLLILDNFEHLLDGAKIVANMLSHTDYVTLLVTSRQRLQQPGETLFHLKGMAFPEWDTPDDALNYAAIQLFDNSARRSDYHFELTSENMPQVSKICRMTQGMPLGIVLAAGWLGMLTLNEIIDELERDMQILEDTDGTLPERQRSISAVMEYSWQQMTPREQHVLMALSVFRGGFTREAAQTVADASLKTLMSLVKKSLLRRDNNSGRYAVHELLRQYAEDKLENSSQYKSVQTAHARWFADYLMQQVPYLKGKGQLDAMSAIEREADNVHQAWNYATASNQADVLLQMIEPVALHMHFRPYKARFEELFERTHRTRAGSESGTHALVRGFLLAYLPHADDRVLQILNDTLDIGNTYTHLPLMALAKRQLGVQLSHRLRKGTDGQPDGINYLKESLQHYQALDDRYYEAFLLDDLGFAYLFSQQLTKHREATREARKIRQMINDTVGLANGARGVALAFPIVDEAIAIMEEGLAMSERIGNPHSIVSSQSKLGEQYLLKGDFERATLYTGQAIELSESIGDSKIYQMAKIWGALLTLLDNDDMQQAGQDINTILPDDTLSIVEMPGEVFVAGTIAKTILYARQKDVAGLRRMLPCVMTVISFDSYALYWMLPAVAFLFEAKQPEQMFIYLHHAYTNPQYGSRWMYHVPYFKQAYDSLAAQFTPEAAPDVWQKVKSITRQKIVEALNRMGQSASSL